MGASFPRGGASRACDSGLAYSIVRSCASQGWVEDISTIGGPAVIMIFMGRAYVEAQRKGRNDAGIRSSAARNALLAYYHRRELEGVLMPETAQLVLADELYFEGGQFSTTDIDRAAAYLLSRGLITGLQKRADGS